MWWFHDSIYVLKLTEEHTPQKSHFWYMNVEIINKIERNQTHHLLNNSQPHPQKETKSKDNPSCILLWFMWSKLIANSESLFFPIISAHRHHVLLILELVPFLLNLLRLPQFCTLRLVVWIIFCSLLNGFPAPSFCLSSERAPALHMTIFYLETSLNILQWPPVISKTQSKLFLPVPPTLTSSLLKLALSFLASLSFIHALPSSSLSFFLWKQHLSPLRPCSIAILLEVPRQGTHSPIPSPGSPDIFPSFPGEHSAWDTSIIFPTTSPPKGRLLGEREGLSSSSSAKHRAWQSSDKMPFVEQTLE